MTFYSCLHTTTASLPAMLLNNFFTGLKKDVCIDNDMIYHTCQGTVGASVALAALG